MDTVQQQKKQIRDAVRLSRGELTPAQLATAERELTAQLAELVTALGAKTVSCYLPVRHEPPTTGFSAWAAQHRVRVLFPSCRDDLLLDWIEPHGSEVVPGKYGIPEPVGEVFGPLESAEFDLMLVPACAVAADGTRLGWGGGFYDRTLGSMEQLPPVYAVVYDSEVFDALPRDEHDIAVTGAVTPKRTVRFAV